MIDRRRDWTWDVRATGIVMTRGTERIRYVERATPLARLVDVARDTAPATWRASGDLAIERFTTCEDEPALLGTEPGTLAGAPGLRALGMVCLDDWYALVDGIAIGTDPAAFCATVRELVTSDSHGRGTRRRRFVYTPPAGWSGMRVAPYHAYWFAPGYPRSGAFLVAFPAQPRATSSEQLAASLTALDTEHAVEASMLVSTRGGLSGIQVDAKVANTTAQRTIVVLEDRSYQYPVLVQAPAERMPDVMPVLRGVLDSIEPFAAVRTVAHASPWQVD